MPLTIITFVLVCMHLYFAQCQQNIGKNNSANAFINPFISAIVNANIH